MDLQIELAKVIPALWINKSHMNIHKSQLSGSPGVGFDPSPFVDRLELWLLLTPIVETLYLRIGEVKEILKCTR